MIGLPTRRIFTLNRADVYEKSKRCKKGESVVHHNLHFIGECVEELRVLNLPKQRFRCSSMIRRSCHGTSIALPCFLSSAFFVVMRYLSEKAQSVVSYTMAIIFQKWKRLDGEQNTAPLLFSLALQQRP